MLMPKVDTEQHHHQLQRDLLVGAPHCPQSLRRQDSVANLEKFIISSFYLYMYKIQFSSNLSNSSPILI